MAYEFAVWLLKVSGGAFTGIAICILIDDILDR